MFAWLTQLVRSVYGLPNKEIKKCDVVIPLSYGLTEDNKLPPAEEEVLRAAVQIAREKEVNIMWASSCYFFPGSEEVEDVLKDICLARQGYSGEPLASPGITNSVTEATRIRYTMYNIGLHPKHIVVVLDWPHARSARLIWRKVFPKAEIVTHSVNGRWCPNHRSTLQRTDGRWIVTNFLRHAILIVFGLERVAKIQHPTKG